METIKDVRNVQSILDEYLGFTDYSDIYTSVITNREQIRSTEGVEILIRQLRHPGDLEPSTNILQRRMNAVIALTAIGEPAICALPVLLQVLQNENEDILLRILCDDAIKGIGQLSIENSREPIIKESQERVPRKYFTRKRQIPVSRTESMKRTKTVKAI